MAFVGVGPLERIDGPPPLRPIFGLLQAAEAPAAGVRLIADADAGGVERWGNGAEVFPYPPSEGHTHDPCSAGSDRDKTPAPPGPASSHAHIHWRLRTQHPRHPPGGDRRPPGDIPGA